MTLDEYFAGFRESRALFDALLPRIEALGPHKMAVTKSQIAFRREKQFAWVWIPEKHLGRKMAPLVLSVSLRWRDPSPRWKEVVEPAQGRFMHHLELRTPEDLDDEVGAWLTLAYAQAG